ncbi:putative toxin-antitoxin system toxin component, PIN family [Candidatus Woesearchaeota archaeon]|nr:putative toxin-antitoxin system toxin component, PIN family [Candidatus Woesearchaeota archaeon]
MLLKLVLDTNTIVSAFFWEGNEAELFRKIEQGKANLYITNEILREVEEVIKRPKFNEVMTKANLTPYQIMQKIVSLSHLVIAQKWNINVCRDKKDNKFLECVESAKADYLVSGDEDMLSLKEYKGIPITRTGEILQLLE